MHKVRLAYIDVHYLMKGRINYMQVTYSKTWKFTLPLLSQLVGKHNYLWRRLAHVEDFWMCVVTTSSLNQWLQDLTVSPQTKQSFREEVR